VSKNSAQRLYEAVLIGLNTLLNSRDGFIGKFDVVANLSEPSASKVNVSLRGHTHYTHKFEFSPIDSVDKVSGQFRNALDEVENVEERIKSQLFEEAIGKRVTNNIRKELREAADRLPWGKDS
jgi:hypothetical protein